MSLCSGYLFAQNIVLVLSYRLSNMNDIKLMFEIHAFFFCKASKSINTLCASIKSTPHKVSSYLLCSKEIREIRGFINPNPPEYKLLQSIKPFSRDLEHQHLNIQIEASTLLNFKSKERLTWGSRSAQNLSEGLKTKGVIHKTKSLFS